MPKALTQTIARLIAVTLVAALCVTTGAAPATAQTNAIHVSPSGSNDNTGATAATPLASVPLAATRMTAGTTLYLAAGSYPSFAIKRVAGTTAAPIVVRPEPGAEGRVILSSPDGGGTGLNLVDVDHVRIQGLVIEGFREGVTINGSRNVAIVGNTVRAIGHRAMRVHGAIAENSGAFARGDVGAGSTDIVFADNTIFLTGLTDPSQGEGIYVGTGGDRIIDNTERVLISGNRIAGAGAESIDVKAGTRNIAIVGNRIGDTAPNEFAAVTLFFCPFESPACAAASSGDSVFTNNVIERVRSTPSNFPGGSGVLVGGQVDVINNTITDVDDVGIFVTGQHTVPSEQRPVIAHNTVVRSGGFGIDPRRTDQSYGNDFPDALVVANNIATVDDGIGEANIAPQDDFFVAPDRGIYALLADAEPRDAGIGIPEVARDSRGYSRPVGTAPDVGVYEYGATNGIARSFSTTARIARAIVGIV